MRIVLLANFEQCQDFNYLIAGIMQINSIPKLISHNENQQKIYVCVTQYNCIVYGLHHFYFS